MSIEEIKHDTTKLREIRDGLQKTDNYMCIDCYIRRMIEHITFLQFVEGCADQAELIRNKIVQYYMNRLDKKVVIEPLSKLITILEEKVA